MRKTLAHEIKQKGFRNIYHKSVVNIIYTNNWVTYRLNSIFKQYDLSPQQFNILRILRGQHPGEATIKLIKERMLDKKSDVSRIVENLVKKKLVTRKSCPDDRRQVHVRISEKGIKLLHSIDKHDEEMDQLAKALTEEEADILNTLLDKLRSSVK